MAETIFTKVDYDLGSLMNFVELGEIALPDIQRPFVWTNAKIRNLFDSMYRGYPVGYFLFWQNALSTHVKSIGIDNKQKPARLLIVDGQQRLTSLYAVIKGVPIIRENYETEKIEIAFNPLTETFEVTDAAIKNNKQFIPNISVLWDSSTDIFDVVDDYLEKIESTGEVSDEARKGIRKAIQKVSGLTSFPLTAIELASQMDEEDVAEVFVRINSQGKTLNQSDFILTLMSVFWEEGRTQLEKFCRDARNPTLKGASPFNYFIQPDPDQLLRVSVGLAFKRARLKYVYAILRGKDLETEQFSDELRDIQFARLKNAQSRVLNLQHWHDYLHVLRTAGFKSDKMISSKTNVVFTYILYLIGKTEFNVDEYELRKVLAQWFFMAAITGRYSSSPESKMEFDLARIATIHSPEEYCRALRQVCNEVLTEDFWSISLPVELATAAARSPAQFAFFAALNLLDANVLFSNQKVSDLLDPNVNASRSAIEKHHLFPKAYLNKKGMESRRDTNQIANYSLVEWGDNAKASDGAPSEYLPLFKSRFTNNEIERMYYWHALPENWEDMEYQRFLVSRRERIAQVIRDAYQALVETSSEEQSFVDINELVKIGESDEIEFKSTLRVNLHTGERDPRMEHACLRTIAGFLNRDGGTLVVGVTDDGEPIGLDPDKFPNEDKMNLHFDNLIRDKIGAQFSMYISPRFEEYDGVRVYIVECSRSRAPVYVKDANTDKFYVRTGASTTELAGQQMQDYIAQRF